MPLAHSGQPCEVTVWNDRCAAFDAGDDAAAWLTELLQRAVRLVRFDPSRRRLSACDWTGGVEAANYFSDGFPILAIGTASLEDLNARLATPLPMNRFRPNLVLEGLAPYDKDRIDELHAEGLRLKIVAVHALQDHHHRSGPGCGAGR